MIIPHLPKHDSQSSKTSLVFNMNISDPIHPSDKHFIINLEKVNEENRVDLSVVSFKKSQNLHNQRYNFTKETTHNAIATSQLNDPNKEYPEFLETENHTGLITLNTPKHSDSKGPLASKKDDLEDLPFPSTRTEEACVDTIEFELRDSHRDK